MDARRTYPPELEVVIRHALRFCDLIEAQGSPGPPIGLAQAWLVGRPREIQAVIALLLVDWEKGRYDEAGAAAAGRAYLEELHGAFGRIRGSQVELTCCHPDSDPSLAVGSSPSDPVHFDPNAVLYAIRPIDPMPPRPWVASAAPPPAPTSSVGMPTAAGPAPSGPAAAPSPPLARAK